MVFFFMDWKVVDERLIRRGELLLSLDFLDGYDDELEAMNGKKAGRPYRLTDRYVEFLAVVRYLFFMPYRQLEGFIRALNRLVPRLPSADYSEFSESKGVEAVIKPRKNSRIDTPSETRGRAVRLYRLLGHKRWVRLKQYGRRWRRNSILNFSRGRSGSSAWQRP